MSTFGDVSNFLERCALRLRAEEEGGVPVPRELVMTIRNDVEQLGLIVRLESPFAFTGLSLVPSTKLGPCAEVAFQKLRQRWKDEDFTEEEKSRRRLLNYIVRKSL